MANGSKNGASTNGHRYTFDSFEIDPANRILLCEGEAVRLTGKAFDILHFLVENPGRLLEKNEFLERLWPHEFVEEGNLTRNISTLRKVLDDTGREHKYIATVAGHGYKFVAEVHEMDDPITRSAGSVIESFTPTEKVKTSPAKTEHLTRVLFWSLAAAVVLFAVVAWFGRDRFFARTPKVTSLAVLPLRSLDSADNYLGIGIADAVIRSLSQGGQLTVRPTSAVLRYVGQNTDTLAAAREMNTDAVLEGTVQRSGKLLRVSVNLLRTGDGASLWTDSFDMPAADIFAIQDRVAQHVASRLQLHLDPASRFSADKRYPANPTAYEFYIRGIASLDERGYQEEGMPQMQNTIGFFSRSIESDHNFAPAHAQLAFAYVWTALFIEPSKGNWADLARAEISEAEKLDPNVAETHVARALLLGSAYEGYKNEDAIRELRSAQQLDPNVGHDALSAMYGHIGLDDLAEAELRRGFEFDPSSQALTDLTLILPYLRSDADAWFSARQKLQTGALYAPPWYYLRKGKLDVAEKAIAERLPKVPDSYDLLMQQALFFALKGNYVDAQARVPQIISTIKLNDQSRHHSTYDAACVYALSGNSTEAVKWLNETAASGFPNYPLFARDPFLDRIRQSTEFIDFISRQKSQWEHNKNEFNGQ